MSTKFCDFYNNLIRKKFLIVIFIVTIIFVTNVNSEICHNMDIRNLPNKLKALENCTMIQGFLQILLMDKPWIKDEHFAHFSFPNIREITGYFFVYRVFGLRSLAKLFPNLTVIRGQVVKFNYAFLIYEANDLEEIGLKSLIQIQRGSVRIQNNPQLCYVNTIDWERITSPGPNYIQTIDNNKCPSRESCRGCEPKYCWSTKNCQRLDRPFNFQNTIKCHPLCLGGCLNSSASGCFVCRQITNNGMCVEECPDHKILHVESQRCVSVSNCLRKNNIIFDKKCLLECPPGFALIDFIDQEHDTSNQTCHPCKNSCQKVCEGAEIVYLSDSEAFKGCTMVDGSLQIKLSDDTKDLMEQLETNLGGIEEILGHLKLYRSMSVSSLSFLRSLTVIHGAELEDDKYGLVVYENMNLQTLFDWKTKTHMKILNGSMFFHYNNKLCVSEIEMLKKITTYTNTSDFICRESNGYAHSCNIDLMNSKALVISTENVTILWEELLPKQHEALLGYLINYIEAPKRDITVHYGRDVCSKYSWKVLYVPADSVLRVSPFLALNVTKLKPYTQYAFYVKTYISQEEPYDTKESQSEVRYFKTLAGPPNPPNVSTFSKTSDSITIKFSVDEYDEDIIDYFTLEILIQSDDPNILDHRDFCRYPKVNEDELNQNEKPQKNCCTDKNNDDEDGDDDDDDDSSKEKYESCVEGYVKDNCEQYLNNRYSHDIDHPSWTSRFDDFRNSLFELAKPKGTDGKQTNKNKKSMIHKLKSTSRDFTISNLKPFTLYTLLVVTCNKLELCSPFYMHTERTASNETADDITFLITNTSDIFYLHFKGPIEPNGLTVGYNIDIIRLDNTFFEGIRCITRKLHERNDNIYTLSDLKLGEYGVRIRSISLAGNGRFTDMQFLSVSPPELDNTLKYSLIGVFVVLTVLFGIGLVIYWRYKTRSKSDDITNRLMSDIYLPNIDEQIPIDNDIELEGAVGGEI